MVALSAAPMTNYVTYAARVIPPRARRAAARSRSLLLVRLITRIINDLIVVTVPAMRRHSPTRPLDAAGVPENDQRQSGHGCSATSAMATAMLALLMPLPAIMNMSRRNCACSNASMWCHGFSTASAISLTL
jgi:hypothetical protein